MLLASPAEYQSIYRADTPDISFQICQPIVTLTNTCDVDPNETDTDNDKRKKLRLRASEEADESIEANCICTNKSFDVAGVMALCASCISQNGKTTDGETLFNPLGPSPLRWLRCLSLVGYETGGIGGYVVFVRCSTSLSASSKQSCGILFSQDRKQALQIGQSK